MPFRDRPRVRRLQTRENLSFLDGSKVWWGKHYHITILRRQAGRFIQVARSTGCCTAPLTSPAREGGTVGLSAPLATTITLARV